MGFLGKAFKGGLAMKAMQIFKREASKPSNQRKARELVGRIGKKKSKKRGRR